MRITASRESLEVLRLITSAHSLSYHEHTHVLYDLRTALGRARRTYVEIGGFLGASASLMLRHPFETAVCTIDPMVMTASDFNGIGAQERAFMKNVAAANHHARPFHLVKDYSGRAVARVREFAAEIDILFVDGDHAYAAVLDDFLQYAPLVSPGGFVVFDDYRDRSNPEVRYAVDEIVARIEPGSFEAVEIAPNEEARPSIGDASNEFVLRRTTPAGAHIFFST